jgi:acetyl-CoA carboxylase carboxyl transferase subunit alpha
VISPEACASILYRDSAQAPTAAACLKLTAGDLLGLGIIDEVIAEPLGGAHHDAAAVFLDVGDALKRALDELSGIDTHELVAARYERLRAMGAYAP